VPNGAPGGSSAGNSDGLLVTILLALLGGFFLNLMPCVFPVLSIKIMGFMHCAKECPSNVKKHGLAFSIGVILSFLILAGLLLTLRAGGAQLGWGFQLQSPLFVLAMIGVFFILGLYFLVDLNFGSSIQTLACKGKLPPSLLGSFLNGVLATAVATPCTGPFMGTALAATVTLPAFQSMLTFLALGIGMSVPYLVLSFQPRLLCYLPRPGEWMVTFKQVMAFPLFASAVWLTRVFGKQVGIPTPSLTLLINVLWGLLFLGIAVWLIARSQHSSKPITRRVGQILALLCIVLGIISAYPSPMALRNGQSHHAQLSSAISGARNAVEVDPFGLEWEMFSSERLQELVNSNAPVYLDFTAEWCITCKVNERVVFGSASVRELLRKKKVALVKGDWTAMDGEITKALERFGRNGVPLNVLYKGGAFNKEPVIFPNVLSPGAVISELEQIESGVAE
jgi:thiol:disulfide interchange protein DsbD